MIADLRSDTVTRPTPAMYQAMMTAPLGDDVLGDDPSVHALEARCIELSGKEAAVFVPSGTMGNQIAIAMHTRPGDAVLMEEGSHPFNYESAGASVIAGVQIRPLPGVRGLLAPDTVAAAIPPDNVHFAQVSLLVVENTSNRGGGTVYPLDVLDALAAVARERGLKLHLDGARVFNAAVASGQPLSRIARDFDSLTFCLSKGLGAPIGSVLCGSASDIHRARYIRKRLGGGMRQSGILAAAGSHALQHHVDRLSDDHARAQRLAAGLRDLGLPCEPPQTNMVYVQIADAHAVVAKLQARGVLTYATADDMIRLVTHLDVDDQGIDGTVKAFAELV